jgi:DivIVA domain-containing protein
MPEGRAPISSSRVSTGDIARHSFAVVRRGFDTDEVRSYLQSVARSIEAMEEREQELRAAIAEAEERAAHPVVDEATLTASLGQHSAQILRHAHEEAARIAAQAQEASANLLRETQSQVDELQTRTEAACAERVVEVELMISNTEHEARAERERILGDAVSEGEAVVARAKEEGRDLLEQVQEARRRVLADLAARRRALGIQIEQLRAARDEMAASVHGVRDRVDVILDELERSDDEARAAALAVGDQLRLQGAPDEAHDDTGEVAAPVGEVVPDRGEAVRVIGPAGSAEEGGETTATTAPSVDELFARIRAGSDADATEVMAAIRPDGGGAGGEAPAGPDAALVERRDELLDPVAARLSRSVKRALGDDQNRLLDHLRSAPAMSGEDLLGPEDAHQAAFAASARGHLGDAFAAGAVFAGADAAATPKGDAVEAATAGLARTVVTMLRRRIADGSEDVSDRVGAAFREWRGERVERVTGDFATQAFSAGAVAAGAEGKLRWVVTTTGGCSDCEDNALGGAVGAGAPFPTGHAHPPAHAGCRCLVARIGD